jgi:hypothetical protein
MIPSILNDKFIGIFDDTIDNTECQLFIDYFEQMKSLNLTSTRILNENAKKHKKNDETLFMLEHNMLAINKTNSLLNNFLNNFWIAYQIYCDEYSILTEAEMHGIKTIRMQKTLAGQGYHDWHFESMSSLTSNRVVSWMIYLSDVEAGGETEFLYQKERISPLAGRLLFWPSGYTHVHRGNPPLRGEKYILTGWIEYMGTV